MGNAPLILLDTHSIVWWLAEPTKLSAKAKRAAQSAAAANEIVISAATVLEIATLVRRKRLQLTMGIDQWLETMNSLPELHVEPVTAEIAGKAGSFDETVQGDPIDRIIIATAIVLDLPIVSADAEIRKISWVRTIW